MKVLSPENTEHEIVFIPRFYFEGAVVMSLYNEETSVTTTYNVTPNTADGYVYLEFEEDFINNTNFQIKITIDDEVVFRDKLFITDQTDLENYQITKDVFTL